ncbi:hypothetical protein D0C36_15825 [Mucilaginibacter conchicola]|uniref:Uncharacterized protein n=1 Tax=Mucilaginibacter conchicola TaxID=2303333 RepID=A0A372NVU1_9SPHI|nr:hypothetical protein [Mucilaginibacter conchicola]RFZ92859.1 hypothetical protein D0C36_15825 [Mucilaginibacter conchicola]
MGVKTLNTSVFRPIPLYSAPAISRLCGFPQKPLTSSYDLYIMTDQEKAGLLAEYKKRKAAGTLPTNLDPPVPSGIKRECIRLYHLSVRAEGAIILKAFFKKNHQGDFKTGVDSIDHDRFRPTVDLLRDKAFEPEEKHYELLAWLLGPERITDNGKKPGQETEETGIIPRMITWLKKRKRIGITGTTVLLMLVGAGWLIIEKSRPCMYWNGEAYKAASCAVPVPGSTLYAADDRKIRQFKKIMRPDTVTAASVGKLWYFKSNRQLELFTDSGMHPVWSNRRLKVLTPYMQAKYLTADSATKAKNTLTAN